MSLVLLGCADQLIFYFYVVKYNSLDPLCSTIFHCDNASPYKLLDELNWSKFGPSLGQIGPKQPIYKVETRDLNS